MKEDESMGQLKAIQEVIFLFDFTLNPSFYIVILQ